MKCSVSFGLSLNSAVMIGLTLCLIRPVEGLPPPSDIPEEVLRTEVFTEARSPLDGEPLTAAEYAELQAALQSTQAAQPEISPKIRRLIALLRLRKVIRSVFPFLVP